MPRSLTRGIALLDGCRPSSERCQHKSAHGRGFLVPRFRCVLAPGVGPTERGIGRAQRMIDALDTVRWRQRVVSPDQRQVRARRNHGRHFRGTEIAPQAGHEEVHAMQVMAARRQQR